MESAPGALDEMLSRRSIDRAHYDAAIAFANKWASAQAGNMAARSRVDAALRGLGVVDREIVTALLVAGVGVPELVQRMKWPETRYSGPRVCEALTALKHCLDSRGRP